MDAPHRAMRPIFEVRATTGKGNGAIATHLIQRGARIIKEAALVAVPPNTNDTYYLFEALSALNQEEYDAYRSLYYDPRATNVDDDQVSISIFERNNTGMGGEGEHGRGVFLAYSRLNHSCTPNAEAWFDNVGGKLYVHALRDIQAGEEITTSYIDVARESDQRAELLGHWWEFECKCLACEGHRAVESNKRRQRICSINEVVGILRDYDDDEVNNDPRAKPITPEQRLTWAKELVTLCKEERLVGRYLEEAFTECVKWALVLDRKQEAEAFAVVAVGVRLVRSGRAMTAETLLREQEERVEGWRECEVARRMGFARGRRTQRE